MMNLKEKKAKKCAGQSMVEYLFLIAVVTILLVAFLGPGGLYEKTFNRTLWTQGDDMYNAALTFFK